MTRGGNTWLGKIFDSHSRVLYRHEPDSILRCREIPEICEDDQVDDYLAAATDYFLRVFQVRTSKAVGSFPVFSKDFHSAAAFRLRRAMVYGGKAAERTILFPRFFRDMTIPDLLAAGGPAPEMVVKSIAALGRMNLFIRAFPEAKVILLLRHPCGQIQSTLRAIELDRIDNAVPATTDWGIYEDICNTRMARAAGLEMAAIRAMDPVERLAHRWAVFNDHALGVLEDHDNAIVVRYEDLCDEPLAESRRLFDFAGIEWQPGNEDFVRQSSGIGVAAQDQETYDRVFRDSRKTANQWKSKLTPDQIGMILAITDRSRSGAFFEAPGDGHLAENQS
jgi:hypothetical protein